MKCTICGSSLSKGPLFPNAPPGEVCEDWRCFEHLDQEYRDEEERQSHYLLALALQEVLTLEQDRNLH